MATEYIIAYVSVIFYLFMLTPLLFNIGDWVSSIVEAAWLWSKDSTPYAPAEVTEWNHGTEKFKQKIWW